ncbi:hypothetical protein SK128_004207 [Halocaridina rubra]|uniref:Reverse transcriptase domain-containing protein n=1 Tax=Halocaridina rubra TaxID=373956 RepID=A0AAN8WYS1_HALRR
MTEVNERVSGQGLRMVDGDDNEWELNQLLFADDTVVVADSEEKLCQLVSEFGMMSMIGVSRLDKVRNEVVRSRTGVRREFAARVNMNVLRWLSHVERMDDERLLKKEDGCEVSKRAC